MTEEIKADFFVDLDIHWKQVLIEDVYSFGVTLEFTSTMITSTPILMRISRDRYQEYDINTRYPYDYCYWLR